MSSERCRLCHQPLSIHSSWKWKYGEPEHKDPKDCIVALRRWVAEHERQLSDKSEGPGTDD